MNELDPKLFTNIGVDENSTPLYKIHLQHFDEICPETAFRIAGLAGGVKTNTQGGEHFVKFSTNDLPALCKDIERIGSEFESMGSSVL